MDSMDQRLDASFNALMAEILQSRRENDVAHSAMRAESTKEFSTMRAEVAGEFSAVRARFEKVETAIDETRADVAREFSTVRAEVAREFSAMGARFESVEATIDDSQAHLEAAIVDLLGVINKGAEALDSALRGEIRKGDEESRHFMLVLHEQVMSQFKLLGEARPSSS
ncbi:MAG: hypothetical protein NTV05_07585 [Acidobacteria bacterium]|nr:hypothetical protein [Acidobacteriota bacterium]